LKEKVKDAFLAKLNVLLCKVILGNEYRSDGVVD
jgi:hypothetical protein